MTLAASADERPHAVWPWLLAAFAILMLGLLIGPRVPYDRQTEFCVVNVRIAGPFGVSIICDSPEYLRLAREPSGLLEPTNLRQSRPGLVLLAAALVWPLSPLADLAQRLSIHASRTDIDQSRIDNALAKDFPAYAVYVLLNVATVLLSFCVFQLISGPRGAGGANAAIFVSVCFLLAAADPLKPFLWSPHNQMFNIFVPVFAIWASLRASEGAMRSWRFAMVVGLVTGFGATAYPLFIIIVPCVFIAGLAAALSARPAGALGITALNCLLLLALTILPEALWYLFVRYETGGFYQYEMEHDRQAVWILDAWRQGPGHLVTQWLGNLWRLLREASAQMIPAAALLGILALTLLWSRGTSQVPARLHRLLFCCAMVLLVTAAFYATTGYIVWRIAFALVPPLIVAIGGAIVTIASGLPPRQRWMVACACITLTLVQSIVLVIKTGPFS